MNVCLENLPTLAHQLNRAAQALSTVSDVPRTEAEILMAHALGISRAQLLARLQKRREAPGLKILLERRLAFEPLAYILGEWEFFSLNFRLIPPVFVPRPETEHLVEAVLEHVEGKPARILDIGTGCGCIAVAVVVHTDPAQACQIVATDISEAALSLARTNAARHAVADRIQFREGNLFEVLRQDDLSFDVICSNPPYVEADAWDALPPVIRLHEDPRALLAGPDGLEIIRQLVFGSMQHLKPGGLLALEIGLGQNLAVRGLLEETSYTNIRFVSDLAGIPRVALAYTPSR